ncbi:MAG: ribose 5-phosphate isomerase B [Flavobacteriaceae bacterium]|nr:ribose 5-phosphate isomerase B [Flavobacteriaceae bacterium]MDG1063510.1 ribose 5-phosphate isomerase B [Flavobacteriaceae bacterium]
MTIAIGNDHAGTEYKQKLTEYLNNRGFKVENFGTDGDQSVDYPDHVHPLAVKVGDKTVDFGVLICGSGNGVAMTANKYQNVRAALCWEKEIASLARQHNDANIICIPARFVSLQNALEMLEVFIDTVFEGGRHANRVNKIACA